MFLALPFLLASAAALSGGDTVRKQTPPPPASEKSAKAPPAKARPAAPASRQPAVTLAGTRASNSVLSAPPAAPRQPLLGAAIGKTIANVARSAAPRATYLKTAIANRAAGGPALPRHIKGNPSAVAIVADSIVVEKSRRTMTLYHQGSPVRIYFVALGQNPVGDKVGRGDNRTPEGLYYIAGHNPGSKYHLSLKVSYPNDRDIAEARSRGLAAGGDIMIHGLPKGFENVGAEHRQRDWTNGCIAVTNAEIEEIWSAIPAGAAIHIKP